MLTFKKPLRLSSSRVKESLSAHKTNKKSELEL